MRALTFAAAAAVAVAVAVTGQEQLLRLQDGWRTFSAI